MLNLILGFLIGTLATKKYTPKVDVDKRCKAIEAALNKQYKLLSSNFSRNLDNAVKQREFMHLKYTKLEEQVWKLKDERKHMRETHAHLISQLNEYRMKEADAES